MTLYNKENDINKILENLKNNNYQLEVFDKLIISFFSEVEKKLLKFKDLKKYPDLFALGFFLRKKNIENIIDIYKLNKMMPLGIVFHITPSNMPTNFFYSYFFGLICGNVNIIRIPNKNYFQIEILINLLKKIFKLKKFKKIKDMSFFLRYEKNTIITEKASSICDCRIIWGGEKTINNVRKIPIPSKSREITFSDKFSCTIINSEYLNKISKKEILNLCNFFFSDAYFVDQNACSSPHLILWHGKKNYSLKKYFWFNVNKIATKKYDMPLIGSVDKFSLECQDATKFKIKKSNNINNTTIVNELVKLPKKISDLRGKWGYFYEFNISNLNDLKFIVSDKFQTLSYFGYEKSKLFNVLKKNKIKGIDRIIPIGNSHVMDTQWDGYDMIYSLTRVVS